jgi:hypothetical protein
VKSMTIGIITIFAGYTIASYGVVLLKGWDITWRQWISPLNPWQWSGTPPPIPTGQVFPGGKGSSSGATAAPPAAT